MGLPTSVAQWTSNVAQARQSLDPWGLFPAGTIHCQYTNAMHYSTDGVKSYKPIAWGGPNGAIVKSVTATAGNGTPNFLLGRGFCLTPPGKITTLTKSGTNDSMTIHAVGFPADVRMDGWLPGQLCLICNNATLLNNVQHQVKTLTSATVLTFSGQNDFNATDSAANQTFAIRNNIISAAIACSTTPASILNSTNIPSVFAGSDAYLELAPWEFLTGFFDTAPTAPADNAVNPPHFVYVELGMY